MSFLDSNKTKIMLLGKICFQSITLSKKNWLSAMRLRPEGSVPLFTIVVFINW